MNRYLNLAIIIIVMLIDYKNQVRSINHQDKENMQFKVCKYSLEIA